MKKTIKIIAALILIAGGLIALTYFRIYGIHFGGLNISAEQVNMFVDSAGTKIYAVWVGFILLIFFGFWMGKILSSKRVKTDSKN